MPCPKSKHGAGCCSRKVMLDVSARKQALFIVHEIYVGIHEIRLFRIVWKLRRKQYFDLGKLDRS